jgi:hypothetical protein
MARDSQPEWALTINVDKIHNLLDLMLLQPLLAPPALQQALTPPFVLLVDNSSVCDTQRPA